MPIHLFIQFKIPFHKNTILIEVSMGGFMDFDSIKQIIVYTINGVLILNTNEPILIYKLQFLFHRIIIFLEQLVLPNF